MHEALVVTGYVATPFSVGPAYSKHYIYIKMFPMSFLIYPQNRLRYKLSDPACMHSKIYSCISSVERY